MGFGVAGVDGCAAESLEPSGVFPGGGGEFGFGEVAVGGEGEDAAEVPEAGEGGDEFDEVFAAEGVEGLEVAGGVGVVGAGDVGVELEAEGVLEVELEVVDFEGGEETDAAFEGFEAGDAPAADVEVVAAEGPCGGVGDGEAGEGVGGGLLADLAEGLEGVEVAGGVGGGDVDVAGGDAELVGFGAVSYTHLDVYKRQVWGLVTGTIFGINPEILARAGLDKIQIPFLTDPIRGAKNIMGFCFLIGAIQITIGHLWNVVDLVRDKQLKALEQLGWTVSTWFMFFLADSMVLGGNMLAYLNLSEAATAMFWKALGYAFAGSVVLIILFMMPPRELKDGWFNLALLPLNLVGNFTDVVSYVRLYACLLYTSRCV